MNLESAVSLKFEAYGTPEMKPAKWTEVQVPRHQIGATRSPSTPHDPDITMYITPVKLPLISIRNGSLHY